MISSSIYAKDVTKCYPKALQTAIEFLKSRDFTKAETGRYEIQGDDIFANVMDCVTKPVEEGKAEAHEKYIDVQFVASGAERIGFAPDCGNYEVEERFDDRDVFFYKEVKDESYIDATPGCYNIFFLADVHKPGLMCGKPCQVRKVVVKVKAALL